MKNALILHGAGNNSQGNWFPWLKEELEKQGYQVWSPDLPDSNVPMRDKWLGMIFGNKDWEFNEETIIIGHSAGATCILRILEQLPEGVIINKAILVGGVVELGTIADFFPYKRDMVTAPFDWEKIKRSAKEFTFIASDNDPYQCGIDQAKIMESHLGGKVILKEGQGHFNLEIGPQYKQFPLLLTLIA